MHHPPVLGPAQHVGPFYGHSHPAHGGHGASRSRMGRDQPGCHAAREQHDRHSLLYRHHQKPLHRLCRLECVRRARPLPDRQKLLVGLGHPRHRLVPSLRSRAWFDRRRAEPEKYRQISQDGQVDPFASRGQDPAPDEAVLRVPLPAAGLALPREQLRNPFQRDDGQDQPIVSHAHRAGALDWLLELDALPAEQFPRRLMGRAG
mmetsp:Transcript_2171/g.4436  ORF Transcript_2171/g.4436 Transcript_2171/m.4436 type:complete len:204 (-) Transcript_2171:922-1533(-)